MKTCIGKDCTKKVLARNMCGTHWRRWKTHGDMEKLLRRTLCTKEGCSGKHVGRGFCARHYEEFRRESGYKAKFTRKPRTRYTDCLRYAKSRNLEWTISFDDYSNLIKNNCTYCNGPLPETKVGLDRKDNFKGYILENVVPCCRYCNQIKSNIFEYEEFLQFSKTDLFKTVTNRLHNRIKK